MCKQETITLFLSCLHKYSLTLKVFVVDYACAKQLSDQLNLQWLCLTLGQFTYGGPAVT